MVGRAGVTTVCTGNQLHSFAYDYHSPDTFDHQKASILSLLDGAKKSRIVCVFAMLIATQSKSAAQLEELGFVRVFDAHNYKYPDTSKRLWMYTRDMNDWVVGVSYRDTPAVVDVNANPFHIPDAAPAAGRPVVVPVGVAEVAGQAARPNGIPPIGPRIRTGVTIAGQLSYPVALERGVLRRQYQATFRRNLPELGRWVDIPRENTTRPGWVRYYSWVQLQDGRVISANVVGNWDHQNPAVRVIRVFTPATL